MKQLLRRHGPYLPIVRSSMGVCPVDNVTSGMPCRWGVVVRSDRLLKLAQRIRPGSSMDQWQVFRNDTSMTQQALAGHRSALHPDPAVGTRRTVRWQHTLSFFQCLHLPGICLLVEGGEGHHLLPRSTHPLAVLKWLTTREIAPFFASCHTLRGRASAQALVGEMLERGSRGHVDTPRTR